MRPVTKLWNEKKSLLPGRWNTCTPVAAGNSDLTTVEPSWTAVECGPPSPLGRETVSLGTVTDFGGTKAIWPTTEETHGGHRDGFSRAAAPPGPTARAGFANHRSAATQSVFAAAARRRR